MAEFGRGSVELADRLRRRSLQDKPKTHPQKTRVGHPALHGLGLRLSCGKASPLEGVSYTLA